MKGCRVVEVNLEAANMDELVKFYEDAFGVRFDRDQHGSGPVHYHVVFGTWQTDSFFLLNISQADGDPRPSSFGFLVDDLKGSHRRCIAAGAKEVAAPQDIPGMPRSSSLKDPSGNTSTCTRPDTGALELHPARHARRRRTKARDRTRNP